MQTLKNEMADFAMSHQHGQLKEFQIEYSQKMFHCHICNIDV